MDEQQLNEEDDYDWGIRNDGLDQRLNKFMDDVEQHPGHLKELFDPFLQTIISLGFQANSIAGVRFRKWATPLISEYMMKGFLLDDKRFKGNR